ncbi:unannotated protein [freshwater metagenome]|uniref:Unannotated protein n=1 Tax=freshwater metagenome TaxID=449393 RepID=A0A6J7AAL1_9ZZZZ|nr:hypothetical protein [Actinomycetota bacterium]
MSLIEIEQPPQNSKKFPRIFVGVAISMAIASIGLAVGALINLGGPGGSKELGLGQTLTPACDSVVTFQYFTSIENRADLAITLNEVQMSDISSNCAGKDFIITARDNDGNALPLSRDANGNIYTSARIHFSKFLGIDGSVDENGNLTDMFTLVGGNPEAIVVQAIAGLDAIAPLPESSPGVVNWDLSAPYTYWELSKESNSVSIVFNPYPIAGESSVAGFLNPRRIKLFTLESTDA